MKIVSLNIVEGLKPINNLSYKCDITVIMDNLYNAYIRCSELTPRPNVQG